MVIFVGDNGTPSAVVDSGVDRSKAKGTVYQRGVRVPLIIAGPQVVNGGRVEDALISGTDLFATIADLSGQSQTSGIDSISLQPYLAATTHPTARSWVYTETFTGTSPDNGSAALRDSRYKLVENLGAIIGFYDLQSDPEETTNLYGIALTSSQQASYDTLRVQLNALHGH
jgi:arylsulfatase A-like enzyme